MIDQTSTEPFTTSITLADAERAAKLSSVLEPLFRSMLTELKYEGAPKTNASESKLLLLHMMEKAKKVDYPLWNDNISSKGFLLGHSLALFSFPGYPVSIQTFIGTFTWLVVQIDDKAMEMHDAINNFQRLFLSGQSQLHPVLGALADILRSSYEYYDSTLANLLVTSTLDFVSSNCLDIREEFVQMPACEAGINFPYYFRNMAGLTQAFAVFTFPKAMFPDISCFLEAIPDMAIFINLVNDVLSFWKEELAGEERNYMHNRARCEGKSALDVVQQVKAEAVESFARITSMLKNKPRYAEAWVNHAMGHIANHTTNPRYKLDHLGLAEWHPIRKDDLEAIRRTGLRQQSCISGHLIVRIRRALRNRFARGMHNCSQPQSRGG